MNRRKFLQSLVLIPLASYIKLEATPIGVNTSKNNIGSTSSNKNNKTFLEENSTRSNRNIEINDIAHPRESFKRERIETVPIAGFQYYQGENLWHKLKINDNLSLIRETENKFDENSIIIQWKGEQLGYIPRLDNQTIAQLMDEGNKLDANIVKLSKSKNPWNRVEIALYKIN